MDVLKVVRSSRLGWGVVAVLVGATAGACTAGGNVETAGTRETQTSATTPATTSATKSPGQAGGDTVTAVEVAQSLVDDGIDLEFPIQDYSLPAELGEQARRDMGFQTQTNLFLTNDVELNIRVYFSPGDAVADLADGKQVESNFTEGRDLDLVTGSVACGTIGVSSSDMISPLDTDPRTPSERKAELRETLDQVYESLTERYGPCRRG